jgi:signal transduction histidine kinase
MPFSQIPEVSNNSIMRMTKRNLALGFGFLLLLLGLNAAISYSNTRRLIQNNRWVTHTYQVVAQLDQELSLAQDVETGTRGFIITGQEKFLEPYQTGVQGLHDNLSVLSSLVRDNPQQSARVAILEKQLKTRLEVSRRQIALRRTKGLAAAEQDVSNGGGKRAMDAVRATVTDMKNHEFALLNLRQQESAQSANAALLSIGIFTLSGIVLLSLVYTILARAELRKAELQHAYGRLQQLESMRDSLTAMLVHDLRTPLTTLLGPLEMLEGGGFGNLDETQAEIINMSTRSGYRLLGLVNELLDISKMEAGELQVRRETVQAHIVINGAVNQVLRVDQADSGRIVRQVAEDLPLMQADEELLIRVLINLLGNALKFTPSNSKVTVAARAARTDEVEVQNGYHKAQGANSAQKKAVLNKKPADDASQDHAPIILFSVMDQGEGIALEEQQRIFEKFGQVESRQEGHKMSTGLGLTFCKLAVEAHGGHIWIQSEIGRGSTFFFSVPLRPWLEADHNKEKAQALVAATTA